MTASEQATDDAPVQASMPNRAFFEVDPPPHLGRRMLAEGFGTMLLAILSVVGGWAIRSQAGIDRPLSALAPALVGAGALLALVVALGPVSGAHFNPLVTASQWLRGERNKGCLAAYVTAQLSGAMAGAWLGRLALPGAAGVASPMMALLGSEIFATVGLIMVVIALSYAASSAIGLLALGGWVAMVNVILPAGPIANPALAFGLWCAAAPGMPVQYGAMVVRVVAEAVGAAIALAIAALLYPVIRRS